jgi:mRNA interferase MazF
VLSPRIYNAKSGLALACPITNQAKGYPFEVPVPAGHGATGVILADHVKSVDWKARRAEKLGHCTAEVIDEVRARLAPLLGY